MRDADFLIGAIVAQTPILRQFRRDLHAHPELSFQEQRTAEKVAAILAGWGIEVHRGLGKTGLVGVIRHGTSDCSIGLRADFDALPMTERNTFAHASAYRGKMHACGHDGHTAMLLAAAQYLKTRRDLNGTTYLIFQPAEESGGGAREMIKDGLLERFPMQAVFGVHNWPGLPVGQFAVSPGPVFASSNNFKIVIRGKGTHAAMPQGGIDPVPVACQVVQAFQTIVSRNKHPLDTGVISVSVIHAGEAINVISDTCELRGTVRTFQIAVLEMIEHRMRELSEGICRAFGATCDFHFERYYPATVNHQSESDLVRRVLVEMVGDANVRPCQPTMGAEDFSFYLLERPGCYFLVGAGDGEHRLEGHDREAYTLHSPGYDFNDELISIGGSVWARLVEAWFARLSDLP